MSLPLNRLIRAYERSFKNSPSITLAVTNGCLKCFGDFLAQLLPSLATDEHFALDFPRSLRFLIFGFLHGPCIGKWHEFLEHQIPLTLPRPNQLIIDTDLQSVEAEKSFPQNSATRPTFPSIRSRPQSTADNFPTVRNLTGPSETQLFEILSSSKKRRSVRFGGVLKRLLLDQLVMAPIFVLVFISFTALLEGLSFEDIKARLDHLYWHILTANWKIWPLIQIINFNFMPLQYRVPWQSSCGILWTVFLSLSTHSLSIAKVTSPTTLTTTTTGGVFKILQSSNKSSIEAGNHSLVTSSPPLSSSSPSTQLKIKENKA